MPHLLSFGTQRKTGRDVVDKIRTGFDGTGTLLFLEQAERCRQLATATAKTRWEGRVC